MSRLKLTYAGRWSIFEKMKELVFTKNVDLKYLETTKEVKEQLLIDKFLINEFKEALVVEEVDKVGIIYSLTSAFMKMVKSSNITVGLDLGLVRNGLVILINDTPIIHSVLTLNELLKLISKLCLKFKIKLVIGYSNASRNVINSLIHILKSHNVEIILVSEKYVRDLRHTLQKEYPNLTIDEIDALACTYLSNIYGILVKL